MSRMRGAPGHPPVMVWHICQWETKLRETNVREANLGETNDLR